MVLLGFSSIENANLSTVKVRLGYYIVQKAKIRYD